jgi:hypothetical protein
MSRSCFFSLEAMNFVSPVFFWCWLWTQIVGWLLDPRIRRKEDGLILPEANEAKATRWAWIKKGSLKFSHAVPVEVWTIEPHIFEVNHSWPVKPIIFYSRWDLCVWKREPNTKWFTANYESCCKGLSHQGIAWPTGITLKSCKISGNVDRIHWCLWRRPKIQWFMINYSYWFQL